MRRAVFALVMALAAQSSWAATTKPTQVTTTYTNSSGATTSAEVLLRSETTAGAVTTRKTVGTGVSTIGRMARTAVTRGNVVGLALTTAVMGIGWYVDEATRQVMEPQKLTSTAGSDSIDVYNGCALVPKGQYVETSDAFWTVQSYAHGLKRPWVIVNNCANYQPDPDNYPQLLIWPKSAGIPTAQPKIIPWDTVVSTPGMPTSSLPGSSLQDGTWQQDWPELQDTVTTVNNSVTNFYEGDKTNYDTDTISQTKPADEVQMPTLNPWEPAYKPLRDLNQDIPKTDAPISSKPSLPTFTGTGLCKGFDVNLPPILVGTLNRHCYYIDTFIRPMLMWLFYMWTIFTMYITWQREVSRGIV